MCMSTLPHTGDLLHDISCHEQLLPATCYMTSVAYSTACYLLPARRLPTDGHDLGHEGVTYIHSNWEHRHACVLENTSSEVLKFHRKQRLPTNYTGDVIIYLTNEGTDKVLEVSGQV